MLCCIGVGLLTLSSPNIVNAEGLTQQFTSAPAPTSTLSASNVDVGRMKPTHVNQVIPFRPNDDIGSVANLAGAMMIVLIVLALVVTFLRKRQQLPKKWFGFSLIKPANPVSTSLQVQKQIMLTPKNSLHVVMWGNEELLIACSDHENTLIARRDKADSAVQAAHESTLPR